MSKELVELAFSFQKSKVLITAVKLDLFSLLAQHKQLNSNSIKGLLKLNCTDRQLLDFLDVLASAGFVQREGLLEAALYSNAPQADQFLDKSSPSYIGHRLVYANDAFLNWGRLEEVLATGKSASELRTGLENTFDALYASPEKLKLFLQAMGEGQREAFKSFAGLFDFGPFRTFVDVGGAMGDLCIAVAALHPHLRCTSFDLPVVCPLAQEHVQAHQLQDRIEVVAGDFFKEPLPPADLIAMGSILHDWDEPKKRLLLRKAHAALRPGGAFVAIEAVVDAERRETQGLLASLHMLVSTGGGFNFGYTEFTQWAQEEGFSRFAQLPLGNTNKTALVAWK